MEVPNTFYHKHLTACQDLAVFRAFLASSFCNISHRPYYGRQCIHLLASSIFWSPEYSSPRIVDILATGLFVSSHGSDNYCRWATKNIRLTS
ncbi:hypothetical protein F3Y22_tig00111105pilonHSYRG00951 [Hibiscus syriacus]|uniref:Uncharacterized protein n=1 Tax=Hibiscus syriacus TaxID=106335 RepID=A0A6A2Z077_HIBSY|nr:hypothetical protein F3Y22_tig00111105pilonHSYRG00951 [Hibiscus syriacus]